MRTPIKSHPVASVGWLGRLSQVFGDGVLADAVNDGGTLAREAGEEITSVWCRKHHREHHERITLGNERIKVHCSKCGRIFVRERRVTYVVTW